jgi:alkylation response protein AidB-like acyl-CoA dehydrogenase
MTLLDDVRALSDEISDRALETETARSVPSDLARKLGALGVFRLYVPAAVGGAPVDPMTACAVVEELTRADGSTGWTSMILNTTFFSSWLDPRVAKEMLATDPELGMAGIFGPIGKAESLGDDTVRFSGRFPFNSGSPHASWFCQGGMLPVEGGMPEWRFFFLPASDVEILDTWHVAGLKGTASHDVAVDGAIVPLERSASPIFTPAPHDDPQFRWSFFALLSSLMGAVPLGIARRALDEFIALAPTKGRGVGGPLAEEQICQLVVAEGEAKLRSSRSWFHEVLAAAWEPALAGDPMTDEHRLAIHLASRHTLRSGIDVVDSVFRLVGGGALYDSSPIQRCWRDIHAAACHIFFSDGFATRGGKLLLGLPTEGFML